MEYRFGYDFSDVRIYTGERATRSADSVNALAYTIGNDIVFGENQFQPSTSQGRRLLAHELAHVVQQNGKDSVVNRSPNSSGRQRGVVFHFAVHVSRELNSDELLLEFVRQYSRLSTSAEAQEVLAAGKWHWVGTPQQATAADVLRGYVLIRVNDVSLSQASSEERRGFEDYVAGLDAADRQALYAEIDRRFWNATQYRPGQRLGRSHDDQLMAEYWRQIRDHMVQTRQAILALPEHVRMLLFDPNSSRALSPRDYEIALRVGQKLAAMTSVELADWRSRTTAVTDDWTSFERSLDAYLAAEAARKQETLHQAILSARLYGLEDLYGLYKLMKANERLGSLPSVDEFGVTDTTVVEARLEAPENRRRLEEGLRSHGFESIEAFEEAIVTWRQGFERSTVSLAGVMLDRLDHVLFVAYRRYSNPVEANALADAIVATGAPGHFAVAAEQSERAIWHPRHALDEGGGQRDEAVLQAAIASARATQAGSAAMQTLTSAHPILGFNDFPLERLGRARRDEVQGIVLDYISRKREAVRNTREEIRDDPEMIYKLDNLFRASLQEQGITRNSIYDRILQDYISDRRISRILKGVALAIVTLALTVLSFGTGTLAIAAGAVAFGLSSWQAVEAWKEYVRMSNAADAQLISEDPSITWLVLAVIGAAADFAAAASAVRALRPAAIAFNETGDITAFRGALRELSNVDARIAAAVERAAEAERVLGAQWQAIRAVGYRLNDITGVVAEVGYRLMVLSWHLAKRGIARFDLYLAELSRVGIIRRVADLSPTDIRALRGPFEEGLRRAADGFISYSSLGPQVRALLSPAAVDDAAAFGRFLGLSDAEVSDIIERAAQSASRDGEALSPEILRGMMRERANVTSADDLILDAAGLPRTSSRIVGAVEQAYEIGVSEGRAFLQGRGWRQWDKWINPFEFNGRYGQGLDDVFVDTSGRLWIVEYKGGTAELAPGQMSRAWVERQIIRLENAGYDFAAAPIRKALEDGSLRGIVISTPHGSAAHVIGEFSY
jgi:hypothetical protein